jgi:hypothetical protein
MSASLESILEEISKLPLAERRQLAEEMMRRVALTEEEKAHNEAIVEKWYGAFKGLDRATVIKIAEDEEFCGY